MIRTRAVIRVMGAILVTMSACGPGGVNLAKPPSSPTVLRKLTALFLAPDCSGSDASKCQPGPSNPGFVAPVCAAAGGAICDQGKCLYPLDTATTGCRCIAGQVTLCDRTGQCDSNAPSSPSCGITRCVASNGVANWGVCEELPSEMSAPPQPVCSGLLNTPCCGIDACSATLRCDPATKKCVVAGECTPHVTRPCTGVTGCAGGFESCDPNGKWSGVCLGGPGKTCPAGWTSDIGSATCTRKKHVTFVMKDDKPDGYNYGRISVGFETYGGTVETTVAFSYGDGGCFSSSTKDAVLLFGEKFQPEELGQCETGAPSKCKAGTSRSGLGSWVEMHKIKGWTPLLQGTCQKVADIDFKASVAMRCSW